MSMATKHLIHPINHIVREDPEFLNKPNRTRCAHCFDRCTRQPPVPLPISRDQDVFRVHNVRFACDMYCAAAKTKNLPLLHEMLQFVYELKDLDELLIPALSIFALQEHGGVLTREEFHAYKLKPHTNDEREQIINANPFKSFVFKPEDPLWRTNQCPFNCMHCRYPIGSNVPVPGVDHYDKSKDRYTLTGLYCDIRCAYRAIGLRRGHKCDERLSWFAQWVSKYRAQGRAVEMQRCPSLRLLVDYYGPFTIDHFRAAQPMFILVNEPPFQDYPFTAVRDTATGFDAVDLTKRQYKLDLDLLNSMATASGRASESEWDEETETQQEHSDAMKSSANTQASLAAYMVHDELEDDDDDYYLLSQRMHAMYHYVNLSNGQRNTAYRIHIVLAVIVQMVESCSTQDLLKQLVKQASTK